MRGNWDWKSRQVSESLFLWYLSFGQAKERYLLSGNPRRGCPAKTGYKNLAHYSAVHILIEACYIHADTAEEVIEAHNCLFE